jgi:uncharacterized protein (DUF305 family)
MMKSHYSRLFLMVGLSFGAMFVLMYAMVNSLSDVYLSVNQFYMAGLMAASMAIIELALMRGMYPDRQANAAIAVGSVITLVAFWVLIRQQAAVGDQQFLRSMIPHHSSAILMCQESTISDAGIQDLCRRIVAGQQAEIEEMKAALRRLSR